MTLAVQTFLRSCPQRNGNGGALATNLSTFNFCTEGFGGGDLETDMKLMVGPREGDEDLVNL